MQMNIMLIGIKEQGIEEAFDFLVHILGFEGIKINAIKVSYDDEAVLPTEIIFIRLGEGIFSPKISLGEADIVFVFDPAYLAMAKKFVKPEVGFVIVGNVTHCNDARNFKFAENVNELRAITNNIFIYDEVRVLEEYGRGLPNESERLLIAVSVLGTFFKLGIVPIRKDSYMTGIKAILRDEKLISLARKIMSEADKYIESVDKYEALKRI